MIDGSNVLRLESGDLPSPVSGTEVSASRMRRRSILRRVHKGAFRYLELYRPLRLSLKLSIKKRQRKVPPYCSADHDHALELRNFLI